MKIFKFIWLVRILAIILVVICTFIAPALAVKPHVRAFVPDGVYIGPTLTVAINSPVNNSNIPVNTNFVVQATVTCQ